MPELNFAPKADAGEVTMADFRRLLEEANAIRIVTRTQCEWPVAEKTLKGTVCGRAVASGERFCPDHKKQLARLVKGRR
jgi:hypothetical protein